MPFPSSNPQGPQQLDGPPPSPVTEPAAASESSRMQMLTGGAGPGQPGGPGGSPGVGGAPDMSGIMMLGQKLDEGLLSLAQALPAQAALFNQCSEILKNAVAQALQSQPGGGAAGGASRGGMAPAGATAQAGPQFAGGGFNAGRAS